MPKKADNLFYVSCILPSEEICLYQNFQVCCLRRRGKQRAGERGGEGREDKERNAQKAARGARTEEKAGGHGERDGVEE